MFMTNPFAELSAYIPASAMQIYVVAMFVFVLGGTILDTLHKKSAKYFFMNAKKAEKSKTRDVSGGEKVSIAMKTVAGEILTSAEFSNTRRRLAHLLTMYGFIMFLVTTVMMIFAEPGTVVSPLVAKIWHLGAFLVAAGGYWFWFFIRVDVAAEGNPWYRVVRADMFIVSLLTTSTFALIWSWLQSSGQSVWSMLFFGLFILSSTVLFVGVYWSKFAHMFFKPAAAYQKRVTVADGSRENLPEPADRTNPADRDRHSMELLKDAPLHMGLGIKREAPKHY